MGRNNDDFSNGTGSGRSLTYYHGTSEAAANHIMQHGFKDNVYLHPSSGIASDYGTHVIKVTIPDHLTFESPYYDEQDHEAKSYGEGAHGMYDQAYYHGPNDTGAERIVYNGKHVTPVSVTKNTYEASAGYRD